MKSIIEIKKISKQYRIKERSDYYALRDVIMENLKNPFLAFKKKDQVFWALKNISLDIKPGEIIGIIGKNGAGKSTLLKILSRITPPSSGEIVLKGRVASLLEVGTGFHPELTGRENIFLNGTILGMTRKEINEKFNDIVNFAEIEKFLDTPVKHYSSGMYMRLAFSVAAHLEPDILIVDEVLAVGDAEFQKKCLGKMKDVSQQGRTILFVSHNLAAISNLCKRTILLDQGRIVKDGDTNDVISYYLNIKNIDSKFKNNITYKKNLRLINLSIKDSNGNIQKSYSINKPFIIEINVGLQKEKLSLTTNLQVSNSQGVVLLNSQLDKSDKWRSTYLKKGKFKISCKIPQNIFGEGIYHARVSLYLQNDGEIYEFDFPNALVFNLHDLSVNSSANHYYGLIKPKLDWSTEWENF